MKACAQRSEFAGGQRETIESFRVALLNDQNARGLSIKVGYGCMGAQRG